MIDQNKLINLKRRIDELDYDNELDTEIYNLKLVVSDLLTELIAETEKDSE